MSIYSLSLNPDYSRSSAECVKHVWPVLAVFPMGLEAVGNTPGILFTLLRSIYCKVLSPVVYNRPTQVYQIRMA